MACLIYDERPSLCRTWFCAWRRFEPFPEKGRPDRCGLMFELIVDHNAIGPFERLYWMAYLAGEMTDFDAVTSQQMVDILITEGTLPIWIGSGALKKLIYPRDAVAEHVYSDFEVQLD